MMPVYLRIAHGLAVESWSPPAGETPADCFVGALAGTFVEATGGATLGWAWADGAWAPPPAAPAPSAADLLAHLEARQADMLASVFAFDLGTADAPIIATTRLDARGISSMQSLALWGIINASSSSAREPYSNIDFSPLSLTPQQALTLSTRAGAVLSASYAVLTAAAAAILAAPPTVTTTEAIDALAWPTAA